MILKLKNFHRIIEMLTDWNGNPLEVGDKIIVYLQSGVVIRGTIANKNGDVIDEDGVEHMFDDIFAFGVKEG